MNLKYIKKRVLRCLLKIFNLEHYKFLIKIRKLQRDYKNIVRSLRKLMKEEEYKNKR